MHRLSVLSSNLGWWRQLAPKWPPTKTKFQMMNKFSFPVHPKGWGDLWASAKGRCQARGSMGGEGGRQAGGYIFSPEAAVAFVGVEAAAWFRAWAGMRIEARDGLLDSSRREVEQTELAHHLQTPLHAGSATWTPPHNSNLRQNTCPYSQRSHYIFFFADQQEETTMIFGKAAPRVRLS